MKVVSSFINLIFIISSYTDFPLNTKMVMGKNSFTVGIKSSKQSFILRFFFCSSVCLEIIRLLECVDNFNEFIEKWFCMCSGFTVNNFYHIKMVFPRNNNNDLWLVHGISLLFLLLYDRPYHCLFLWLWYGMKVKKDARDCNIKPGNIRKIISVEHKKG